MTEKEGRFKRQLDAVGKAAAVYMPPAKRRQLLLEKEEAERRKLEEKERQQITVNVEDGEPEGKEATVNGELSSYADPKDGAVASGDSKTGQQEQLQELASKQRETWQDQRRVINGTINRLNSGTIKSLIQELFQNVNLVRLRGPFCKFVLSAAVSSPKYSDVYAAIIAVVNSKLPEVGELMVKRAILSFRRYYKQRDKASCQAVCIYIVHLFHQGVVHELIVLQLLSVLLDGARPTDDSVEVAVHVLQIAGQALLDCSSAGVRACTERMRSLLHEGYLNQRVEYRVEELLKARKNGFKEYPSISEDLDLVERDDQITFDTSLDDEDIQKEDELDVFSFDPEYEEHEEEWSAIRAEILGLGDSSDDDSDDSDSKSDDESDSSDDNSQEEASASGENALVIASNGGDKQAAVVEDLTEADLVHLRRTIYLTIMSSATFEECAHKLARIDVPPGRESELINMLIECCSQERTFLRYYGLIASRFCLMDNRWKDAFMESFSEQYNTIHRLETNKLRNVAKLFSHLLHTDSMPWSVMNNIHLNEDETTSSSRIFIKIVIQEMAEAMGIAKLKYRFDTHDEVHKLWYAGMFPKDNVRNTRYAINFFTSIGLGPLTDDLREFLKNAPKLILAKAKQAALAKKDENSGDESSSVSSTSSSSSSSSSSSYSTSSYSSYTSSSTSSSSSSGSYYRGRGHSSNRGRSRRGRRRRGHSSDSSASSSSRSRDDSRSRDRERNDSRRSGRRGGRSRSPPKVITRDKNRADPSRSASRARSPSSSLSRSRRKEGGRRRSHDRSRSPPKVISSKQDRDHRKSASRSPPRGTGKRSNYLPGRSPRRPSNRSPPRGRKKKIHLSPIRSPPRSSSRSPPIGKGSRRSPPRRRGRESNRSTSRSPPRPSSRSPPRRRGSTSSRSRSQDRSKSPPKVIAPKKESPKENRGDRRLGIRSPSSSPSRSRSPPRSSRRKGSMSLSRSRSPSLGSSSRRKNCGSRSHARRRHRSSSSCRSPSSDASRSSGSGSRSGSQKSDTRRHRSSRKNGRRPPSNSRSRSRSPPRSAGRKGGSRSAPQKIVSKDKNRSRDNRINSRSPSR